MTPATPTDTAALTRGRRARRPLSVAAAAAALLLTMAFVPAAWAVDTTPSTPVQTDPLAGARQQVAAKRWDRALAELKRVDARGNADWNNLMGYTLRKQSSPDLDGAQAHYDAALRIDPRHRGALEYAGELALMKGDLPRAEAHVVTLTKVCAGGCEELADLLKAVDRFKANGNRYQP